MHVVKTAKIPCDAVSARPLIRRLLLTGAVGLAGCTSGSGHGAAAPAPRVAAQPAPGTCHARGSGLLSLPDPACTPGAVNPAVTQATIQRTICVRGWTSRVRPPERVTEPEKAASMAAYGDSGSMRDYEYDHLIPLALGGATNDPRNLWPEPGASPNPKDAVEERLSELVCRGRVTLAFAQRLIARDWIAARAWVREHSEQH